MTVNVDTWGTRLDKATLDELTVALDKTIVATAKDELGRLSQGRDRVEVAEKICGAFRSLDRLQCGIMPDYDEWTALFYMLWYQPDRINLAYSLVQIIVGNWDNLFVKEGQALKVSDFGCGELAMQFGMGLGMADTLGTEQPPPALTIISSDTSQPMISIGQKFWKNFISEINIGNYANLATIKHACNALKPKGGMFNALSATPQTVFSSQDRTTSRPNGMRWLTALHVAYKENYEEVREKLDSQVDRMNPDLILVSAQNVSSQWLYNPKLTYPNYSRVNVCIVQGNHLAFRGVFPLTWRFRKRIYNGYIARVHNALPDCDVSLAEDRLTDWPTRWVTSASFNARCAIYI